MGLHACLCPVSHLVPTAMIRTRSTGTAMSTHRPSEGEEEDVEGATEASSGILSFTRECRSNGCCVMGGGEDSKPVDVPGPSMCAQGDRSSVPGEDSLSTDIRFAPSRRSSSSTI